MGGSSTHPYPSLSDDKKRDSHTKTAFPHGDLMVYFLLTDSFVVFFPSNANSISYTNMSKCCQHLKES